MVKLMNEESRDGVINVGIHSGSIQLDNFHKGLSNLSESD